MNLEEELQRVFMELLQEKWDEHLVDTWTNHKEWRLGKMLYYFADANKISKEVATKLQRAGTGYLSKVTVARYIAEFLPELNALLWDSKLPKEEILKRLKKMQPLSQALHGRETQAQRKTVNYWRKKANAEQAAHDLVRDQRERTSKSAWGVVK